MEKISSADLMTQAQGMFKSNRVFDFIESLDVDSDTAWKSLKVYLMNRRPTTMNDLQQTAFNTIDAINKNDEAKFYEGVAKMAEMKHVNSEVIVFEICKSLYDQGLELMKIGRNK